MRRLNSARSAAAAVVLTALLASLGSPSMAGAGRVRAALSEDRLSAEADRLASTESGLDASSDSLSLGLDPTAAATPGLNSPSAVLAAAGASEAQFHQDLADRFASLGSEGFVSQSVPVSVNTTANAFALREQPVIPLPAAAWTGIFGLGCLGLLRFNHRFRRLIGS